MDDEKDTLDDDIVPENGDNMDQSEPEIEAIEAQSKEKIKELRTRLKGAEAERHQAQEDLLRARADFLNTRKRLEEQLTLDRDRATDKMLIDLISLMDSFDQAMADKAQWETIDVRWRSGVEAIREKLLSILRNNNVSDFDPAGQKFDPQVHDAVSSCAVTNDEQIDMVISVLQKGYKRNGRILRPARVIVGSK